MNTITGVPIAVDIVGELSVSVHERGVLVYGNGQFANDIDCYGKPNHRIHGTTSCSTPAWELIAPSSTAPNSLSVAFCA